MAVLVVLMVMILSVTNYTSSLWRSTTGQIATFQSARTAFESLTRTVSQATLNTYLDYFDANGDRALLWDASKPYAPVNPTAKYGRYSELHFISGPSGTVVPARGDMATHAIFFQAPLGYSRGAANRGLAQLLAAAGYFVEFNSDVKSLPPFLAASQARSRYRLMQFLQPSEDLKIYDPAAATPFDWFRAPLASATPPTRIVADNIIALILLPKAAPGDTSLTLGTSYLYDSRAGALADPRRHQLPPLLQVTMVAISENSAVRLDDGSTPPSVLSDALANRFTNAANYAADLEGLKNVLSEARIEHRVFTSDVSIRAAKWSEQ